jgi:hypothetical protein
VQQHMRVTTTWWRTTSTWSKESPRWVLQKCSHFAPTRSKRLLHG